MVRNSNFKYGKESGTPKYLIICDGGNVRSHALATTLKLNGGREAIAVGRLYISPESMGMLCEWADRIILTQPHMEESVPILSKPKITVVDIGPDRWGIYIPPELNQIVNDEVDKLLLSEAK